MTAPSAPSDSPIGDAPTPPASPPARPAGQPVTPRSVTGILLRFISCGLLCLAAGATWRLTRAPQQVGVTSALGDIFILLSGFIVGGILWYLRDVRVKRRHPEAVSDERMAFSLIVFALIPLAVLLLIGVIWLLSLLIGV